MKKPTFAEPDFELVMPAFNEAASLTTLLARAADSARRAGMAPGQSRLVVVNNGSTDGTQGVLDALSAGEHAEFVRAVHLPHNKGYGHGLWAGLSSSRARYVGWTHADEQCDPADAFAAYAMVQAAGGQLVVKGARHGRAAPERFVTAVFEAVANASLGLQLRELNAQPKVMPRAALAGFRRPPTDFAFDLYALYQARKAGLRVESIDVNFAPRAHGVSRWAANPVRRAQATARMLAQIAALKWREGRLPRV